MGVLKCYNVILVGSRMSRSLGNRRPKFSDRGGNEKNRFAQKNRKLNLIISQVVRVRLGKRKFPQLHNHKESGINLLIF